MSNGFFAEYTKYNGWYYGAAKEDCVNDSVIVVEPNGFRQLKAIEGLSIISFYIMVNERERLIRMVKRGDNLLEVFRRIFSDQGLFQFVEDEVDYVIDNNEDLDETVKKIARLVGENIND